MADWFRSWHGAPTDPKWRTIAKRAQVSTALVVAVAWSLMDRASQADERGSIGGLDTETLADFLDSTPNDVERVIVAMREKCVLTDLYFTSWAKRQPKREDDNSLERKRKQRERDAQYQVDNISDHDNVTQCHTPSHNVTLDTEVDTDKKKAEVPSAQKDAKRGIRLPLDWQPSSDDVAFAIDQGVHPSNVPREAAKYRDFWVGKPGSSGLKLDWPATWRNWIRRVVENQSKPTRYTHANRPQNDLNSAFDKIEARLAGRSNPGTDDFVHNVTFAGRG